MIKISTDKAPAAIGPYSQAFFSGNLLFCSGQIGLNPQTGKLCGNNVSEQAEQAIKNIGEILKAAGLGYKNVVKSTCYLTNIAYFDEFNEVYAKYFTENPTRSCVEVKDLPKHALCEIEVIAEKI